MTDGELPLEATTESIVDLSSDSDDGDAFVDAQQQQPVDTDISDLHQDLSQDPNAANLAASYKQQGNEALVAEHYWEAIRFYSIGLEYLNAAEEANKAAVAILLSNRAQAYIKVENYGLAMVDAEAAIKTNRNYAKAYYRRASAHWALGHGKLARRDFRAVCSLAPKDKDARAKLAAVEKVLKEEAFASAIQAAETTPLSSTYNPAQIEIPASYSGPRLDDDLDEVAVFMPGQLPREFVLAAVEYMRLEKVVHKRYLARLLICCKHYFCGLRDSIMKIDLSASEGSTTVPRLTVCGDTHGQFYDVLQIFATNGYPDAQNMYLFNGDFVDRGSFSVEVITTLLLFKMQNPSSIYLTRGNHETKNMNRIYGFEGEVKHKYDEKVFALFLEVFEWLPLGAVIQNQVFVTHGGIPADDACRIDDLNKLKRGMEPPESGYMSDLLWSDPQPAPGKSPSKRGVGFSFGPDISRAFLQRNQLSYIIRSHEVKEGYVVEHDGLCITVFSAPNYCDSTGNKGAYIHLELDPATMDDEKPRLLPPKFVQYEAVEHPNVRPMAYAAGMGGLFM
jgi:serine/threonine-protein phosphatase 5